MTPATGQQGTMKAIVIALCATLVAVIYNESVSLRAADRRQNLLDHMATGDISSPVRFLRGLQNHVLVEGALILRGADLGDFDLSVLANAFHQDPVRRRADINPKSNIAPDTREQLSWLFDKYEATHVLLAQHDPFTLLALNMPVLAASPGAETELRAVQRMALLVSQRK